MKRSLLLVGMGVAAVALAATERALWINGQRMSQGVIEQGGEVYVPVSALRAAGADVNLTDERVSITFTAPGRVQVDAVEGIVGDYVSNGTWRVKVTDVQKDVNPFVNRGPGAKLMLEVRNLSTKRTSLQSSGLESIQVLDGQGRILAVSATSFKNRYTALPPAASFTDTLRFGDPRGQMPEFGEPDKVLILFKPVGGKALKSIRIKLNP
jgi:hypothetical protein